MVRQAHHERRRVELERRRAEIERGALGTNAWFVSSPWAQRAHPTAFRAIDRLAVVTAQ